MDYGDGCLGWEVQGVQGDVQLSLLTFRLAAWTLPGATTSVLLRPESARMTPYVSCIRHRFAWLPAVGFDAQCAVSVESRAATSLASGRFAGPECMHGAVLHAARRNRSG